MEEIGGCNLILLYEGDPSLVHLQQGIRGVRKFCSTDLRSQVFTDLHLSRFGGSVYRMLFFVPQAVWYLHRHVADLKSEHSTTWDSGT